MTEQVRKKTLALLKKLGVPGAIISVRSRKYGNLELFYGYGDLENKILMEDSKDLCWKVGSVTKTFTGTMILQMLDEGKIDLDKPISDYLFDIPSGKDMTVREIGNMRSGVFDYSQDPDLQTDIVNNPERVWLPAELLSAAVSNDLLFPPGTEFNYSNSNTIILGMIIERLNPRDGKPGNYEEELYRRMIYPLDLISTSLPAVINGPFIHGYDENRGKEGREGTNGREEEKKGRQFTDVTYYNGTFGWSAGQIASNVEDLHKYLRKSIYKHETLSRYATKQQRTWASEMTRDRIELEYGFQLERVDNYMGHNGSTFGYSNYILVNGETQTTIVVMCNVRSIDDINPTNLIISDIILKYLP